MTFEANTPQIKSHINSKLKSVAAIMRLNMSLKASAVFYLTGLFCSFYNSVWTQRILNTPWLFTQLN